MNDHEPFDYGRDPGLRERMQRAVGGLQAPDVVPLAIARGRRQRARRRALQGAGAVAAATALVLTVPAVAQDWSGPDRGPSETPVASDPSTATSAPPSGRPGPDDCATAETGWWSKSSEQIKAELAALLPAGTQVGETNDAAVGLWAGNVVTGDDADFTSVTLLPPPGVRGPWVTLQEAADEGPCAAGANKPSQPVQPCEESAGLVTCEEIRSGSGELIGIVAGQVEHDYVNGQEQDTDRTYVYATIAVPGGGHVEVYSAEGTRADRPHTVHDPADVPALTAAQIRGIVTDPVWTS